MKKLTFILTLLGLLLSVKTFAVEQCKIGDIYYSLYTSGGMRTATVSPCKDGSYSGDIVIPESITYGGAVYTVNKIAVFAFSADKGVTSISIPNTVTEIGQDAFWNCKGLKTLTIPSSVKEMGSTPFAYCLLNPLVFEGALNSYSGIFTDLDVNSMILCPKSEVSKIRRYFKGEVYEIGSVNEIDQDGLHYRLFSETKVATLTGPTTPDEQLGEIAIPNVIEYEGITYRVTKIEKNAFYHNAQLTSVTLGDNISEIGEYAFSWCYHLIEAKLSPAMKTIPTGAFQHSDAMRNVYIPEGVTEIKDNAFADCYMLGYGEPLRLPSSVRAISDLAFTNCRGLKDIEVHESNNYYKSFEGVLYNRQMTKLILCPQSNTVGKFTMPDGVYEIGSNAFKDCTAITSIDMPNSVYTIGGFAFSGCYNLWHLGISQKVNSIGPAAFYNCKGLNTIILPRSLKNVGGDMFINCNFRLVVILGPVASGYGNGEGIGVWEFSDDILREDAAIYTYYKDAIAERVSCPVYQLGAQNTIENMKTYLCGAEFDVPTQGMAKPTYLTIGDQTINASADGHYFVKGLNINNSYEIIGNYRLEHHDFSYEDVIGSFTTNNLTMSFSNLTSTQTTIKGTITVNSDETWQPDEVWATLEARKADGSNFIFKNLAPNRSYLVYTHARKGENEYSGNWKSISTLGVQPSLRAIQITPTTLEIQGSYSAGDAKVVASEFPSYESNGKTLLLTGLDPKSTYSVTYAVQYSTGGKESVSKSFTTSALELESLEPKVINLGEAVVCARTNMSDEETNAGFEWRKVDAPDVVPSKSALAVVYDGTLEGIIKNLAATSYYKMRPYYESKSGKKYYGEWIGFDPSDFSYFEPTVHTYANIEVSNGAIVLNGYVLQGSDEILGQGFEYWPMMNMATSAEAPGQNVTRVNASGQRMSVSLTGLEPNATYGYRAFVTTRRGTQYGEERTFKYPEELLGISAPVSVGKKTFNIYNMQGVLVRQNANSLNGLPKGIYIVNGKKIMVK